jgi:hypothetical protein
MVVESLGGRKAVFVQKSAVADSQYLARKFHLTTSMLKKTYTGTGSEFLQHSCTNPLLIDFTILDKPTYKDAVLGKHFVEDGVLKTLVNKKLMALSSIYPNWVDVEDYVGKTVAMRSPLGCQYTDGVCEICAGLIITHHGSGVHLGLDSSTQTSEKITQLLLSAKHVAKTISLFFSLPKETDKLFIIDVNEGYLREEVLEVYRDGYIGLDKEDLGVLSDLQLLSEDRIFIEDNFSLLKNIYLKLGDHKDKYSVVGKTKQTPFLHRMFLLYMKKMASEMYWEGEILWIPLKGWKSSSTFFNSHIQNDSMSSAVKDNLNFLTNDIKSYTSASKALARLTELVYSKTFVNICHLEVLLKAHQVTDASNFSIPAVQDPNGFHFAKTNDNISNRSLGTQFAFEQMFKFLTTINAYLFPKEKSIFDQFFGLDIN